MLAIETGGEHLSVALLEVADDGRISLRDELTHVRDDRHADVILALIDQVLARHTMKVADLALVGVGRGPGSFTGIRVGLSTHGYYEMLVALHFRPSYLAFGAVFATTTKTLPTAPQGLARLARYVKLLDGVVPLVAIGGIDAQVLADVLATGVGSAAVVRAVTDAADPAAAVSALQHAFLQ